MTTIKRIGLRTVRHFLTLLFAIFVAGYCTSCTDPDDSLCDIDYAEIEVLFDWSSSFAPDPDGATLLFYPASGAKPIVRTVTRNPQTIRLSEGDYSVVAFNHSFDDFDNISFSNIDSYSTIQAFAKPYKPESFSKNTESGVVNAPDSLAVASLERFTVTGEMVSRTASRLASDREHSVFTLHLQPRSVVLEINIIVHAKYLSSVSSVSGTIQGLAETVSLGNRKNNQTTARVFIPSFVKIYNPESPKDGLLVSRLLSFGLPSEVIYPDSSSVTPQLSFDGVRLDLTIRLTDNKTVIPFSFDAVHRSRIYIDANERLEIDVVVGAGIDVFGGADPEIVLPDVKPSGGVNPSVDDWGDEIKNDLVFD